MVSYLVAFDPAIKNFPLHCSFSGSVCLSIVYRETMFGNHRSLLARHIGPLLVFCWVFFFFFHFLREKWGVVCLEVFPWGFCPKQLHAALVLA